MTAFELTIKDLAWIDGLEDDPDDLCLHGRVHVHIGKHVLDEGTGGPWCVSTGAYRMMQSLYADHPLHLDQHLLPCCGHFMFIDDVSKRLTIIGCSYGLDWSVVHEGDDVRLGVDNAGDTVIPFTEYEHVVLGFADAVSSFYQTCSTKRPPHDGFSDVAFARFWSDWQQLRKVPHEQSRGS